jgi:hypothetical protein
MYKDPRAKRTQTKKHRESLKSVMFTDVSDGKFTSIFRTEKVTRCWERDDLVTREPIGVRRKVHEFEALLRAALRE